MKRSTWIAGVLAVLVIGVAVVAIAAGFNTTRFGTFTGTSGAYTNLEGDRVAISAVFLTVPAQNTGTIYVVHGNVTNILVSTTTFSQTLSWLDQGTAVPLEKTGRIIFQVSVSTACNWIVSTRVL